MSPTIRIDEDVYRALQTQAEPFIDTPNSVLRRMLSLGDPGSDVRDLNEQGDQVVAVEKSTPKPARGTKKKKRTRAPSGTLLPQDAYEIPLLRSLEELGGGAAAGEVIERLGQHLNEKLKPNDREALGSGVIRWHNRAQFARYELVQRGEMKSDSPRGVWEISDQGRRRFESEGSA